MSLPDDLLDLPDEAVCVCGNPAREGLEVCTECFLDAVDMYADEEVSERRRGHA
jgi:hypothetical protein